MSLFELEKPLVDIQIEISDLQANAEETPDKQARLTELKNKAAALAKQIYRNPDVWTRTQIARHPKRPGFLDFIDRHVEGFVELAGDRHFRDDASIVGGFGTLDGNKVMIIGTAKGSNTKDNLLRNFGMSHPEGYRKAERLMKLADRFGLPVVTLVDTPGAFPGIGAEERNQSEAIAHCIMTMSMLKVPVVSVITGEGGSGGAIAIAMANKLLMTTNAFYSVISPEGCAGIVWGDGSKAPTAAEALKYSADDLKKFGIADDIIPEGDTPGHIDPVGMLDNIKKALLLHLEVLTKYTPVELVAMRYQKYRVIGSFVKQD